MPRFEPTNPKIDAAEQKRSRNTALISLAIASVLGVFAWVGLYGAADKGVERLARIDVVRGTCDSLWKSARNELDTARVDRTSLPDTIDAGSSAELARCGHLRPSGLQAKVPNPREMSGERMPGGLRQ